MSSHNFGWIRSSGNLNVPSFKCSNSLSALSSQNSTDQYLIPCSSVPVFDQGGLSSCVANATNMSLQILMNIENGSYKTLSRLMSYWNARLVTGDTDKDQGTFIHLCFGELMTLGVCEETAWPYMEAEVNSQPPLLAYKEGNDNTINAFYEITSTDAQRLSDVELAIRANHPVVFGTEVGQELENYDGNPNTVFDPPTTSLGGHAITIVGVRTNAAGQKEFMIRNSWGENWGLNGCVWFSAEYITYAGTDDLFVPTQIANLLL